MCTRICLKNSTRIRCTAEKKKQSHLNGKKLALLAELVTYWWCDGGCGEGSDIFDVVVVNGIAITDNNSFAIIGSIAFCGIMGVRRTGKLRHT